MTATATAPARAAEESADSIVRGLAAWASPALGRMADETERMARTLTEPVRPVDGRVDADLARYQRGDDETRARIYPSLRAIASPTAARRRLAIDLAEMVTGAERSLGRWLNRERRAAEIAKAAPPATDDPAELARRADAAMRAQALSSVAVETLVADAERLLADGQPDEADVRLRAAQMAGPSRMAGTLASVRQRCDEALDRTQPHRVAARAAQAEAEDAYREAMAAVGEFASASRALMAASPSEPSAEVAAARALIARYEQ